jgi:hypothetical protein
MFAVHIGADITYTLSAGDLNSNCLILNPDNLTY